MRVIKYILTTCVFYVDDVQEKMTQSLSNDPPATQKTQCVGHRTTRTNRH
jgi:hypothetical protein